MTPRSFDLLMFLDAQSNCAMRFAESIYKVRGRKERESSALNQHCPLFFRGNHHCFHCMGRRRSI